MLAYWHSWLGALRYSHCVASDFYAHFVISNFTFGGVYVPCICLHARWSYCGWFMSVVVSFVTHYYFHLFVDYFQELYPTESSHCSIHILTIVHCAHCRHLWFCYPFSPSYLLSVIVKYFEPPFIGKCPLTNPLYYCHFRHSWSAQQYMHKKPTEKNFVLW